MSNRKMNTSFQNDSIFSFKRAVYDHFLEQFRTEGEKTLLKVTLLSFNLNMDTDKLKKIFYYLDFLFLRTMQC